MSTSLAIVPPPQSELAGIGGAQPEPEQELYGGDGFPELPKHLQKALKDLLKVALQREMYARRQEVMEARRERFYDRGVQYIYWNYQAWGFAPLAAAGANDPGEEGGYEEVYNIYHPFVRALIAGLTANSPGAHAEARTNRIADTIGALAADQYRQFVETANDIKSIQTEVARFFCTDGTALIEVETDGPNVRYGVDEKGDPLTAEIMNVYGLLERKVPITQNELKFFPYLVLSREFEKEYVQDKYPNAVNEAGDSLIQDSGDASGESAYERMARIGVLQGTRLNTASGDTWKNLVTRHRAYFRPAFFRAAPKQVREELEEAFPNGCLLVVCGDAYCASYSVSMDKRVRVAHPAPGDGQNRPSLMHDMVGPQDTFNDCWNQQKEIFDYCIPEVYMDSATLDAMAREERRAEPGAEIPVVLQPNEDIRMKVLFGQNVEVPASMIQALNQLQGPLAQLITGMYDVVLGAGDEHQQTAKGQMVLQQSAQGQMGLAWGAMQKLIADSIENCIRLAAETRSPDEKIAVKTTNEAGDETTTEVEVANFQKGNWYINVDTTYPDTRAMKRAVFNSLWQQAAKDPLLAKFLALPENLELFKEVMGVEELEVPGASAAMQQRREIEELLKSAPSEPTPDEIKAVMQQMAAKAAEVLQQNPEMPPPPPPDVQQIVQSLTEPTVPIDPEWDFHQEHIQVIQDWLCSQERFDEEAKGNTEGIANVKLHGEKHKQALAQQQAGAAANKPPSESMNFKDLPPDGQMQMAAQAGIKLNPAVMAAQQAQDAAQQQQRQQQQQGSGGAE